MESHTGNPKNIGGLNNTLGSLVERVMTPDLPLKFKPLGFTFDKITTVKWSTDGNIYAEIDGLLENGTQAMAVEVKTTLEIEDINDHLKRMEKIRKYANEHGDKREFLGAIAAMIVNPKPKKYALEKGLFCHSTFRRKCQSYKTRSRTTDLVGKNRQSPCR
jgi:hypothetical protein